MANAFSYLDAMFRPTLTGYTLRSLCLAGTMKQADLMRTFHERSRALGQRESEKASSFHNVFGRFVRTKVRRNTCVVGPIEQPIRCLRTRVDPKTCSLVDVSWDREPPAEIASLLPDATYERALVFLDRQLQRELPNKRGPQTGPELALEDATIERWLLLLRHRPPIARAA